MAKYAIYNTNTGNIRTELGGSIPRKLLWPAGDNIYVYNAEVGYTRGNLIIVEVVDDTSAKTSILEEFVEWNPVVLNGTTLNRTAVYAQVDNNKTRRKYERLVIDEMELRSQRKLTSNYGVANTEFDYRIRQDILRETFFFKGQDATRAIANNTPTDYRLMTANDEFIILNQDEMAGLYNQYIDRRIFLEGKMYDLLASNTIIYDYDAGSHWR